MERIDKVLASQGICSRKEAHSLLRKGKVTLDGAVVTAADTKVDPQIQRICVNGEDINYRKYIYIMMNKPAGIVSASRDNRDKTVVDIVPEKFRRKDLFPAGRLDRDTEGLLIITDDGDYAHQMLSPKKGVNKYYEAVVDMPIGEEEVRAFREGIVLADGLQCLPAEISVIKDGVNPTVLIRIQEGKFHQVKRMMLAVGRRVLKLKRIRIGGLDLDPALASGECREISEQERLLVFHSQKDADFGPNN